ncbi:MAG: ribosome small subunit-dependent GTPase A [Phycisphaerae bacterium]
MFKRKGKSAKRHGWQRVYREGEEMGEAAPRRQRVTAKATKLPAWRPEGVPDNVEGLPRLDGMVVGLFPGGAIVRSPDRAGQLICGISGTFRPPEGSSALAVGDTVTVAVTGALAGPHDGDKLRADGMIVSRAKRKTLLARPQPRSGKHHGRYDDEGFLKVIAANMDQLLIVASTRQPELRPALVERFMIVAERGDLRPILVINKTDLGPPDTEKVERIAELGLKPILTSVVTPEGLDVLLPHLVGRKTVLAGPSGAGKSSLVNALVPGASAAVREIRMKDQRGRHTTAAAAVYDLPTTEGKPGGAGGILVDTPGVRELAVEMDIAELPWYFSEFERFAPACRFNDCTHTHEPDCAVIAAVEAGQIQPSRYESYLRMAQTLEGKK